MITLRNPETGADIESVYCERGKEIYKEVIEREGAEEVKTKKVINAKPFILKVGETIDLEEHQANWALQTFGFLQKVGECDKPIDPSEVEEPEDVPDFEEGAEDFPTSEEDRFTDLQIKGWANLKGAEREEYTRLKKMLT